MKRIVYSFVLLLTLSLGALAQDFRATISGQVVDSSGALVQGAHVVVLSLERNVSTDTESNASGRYVLQDLIPGAYVLSVEKAGFKKFVQQNVKLEANDKLGLDVPLSLGQVTEQVSVNSAPSILQTESGSISTTVQNKVLESVPTDGRNIYQFQYTLPGVIKTSVYWGSMELYAFGNDNGVSIGGGKSGENETLVDGVSDTHSDRGVAWTPPLAGTQEFTLQSNQYDAAYGRVGGGVTSVSIKSGTNELHGQVFETLKNAILDGNDWVANANGEPRQRFQNNTYGFEVGGPVVLPKIFNGRNKLFFMLSLESLRESSTGGTEQTLPTQAERAGDFSQLYNDSGQQVLIYDPLTTHLVNGVETRTPFAGNMIPANRINPIAAKAISYFPSVTGFGVGGSSANNYFNTTPAINSYDAWLGKLDYHLSDKSALSFHYGQTPWNDRENIVWGTNAAEPSNEDPATRVSHNVGFGWTYMISPNKIFDLRGGLARYGTSGGNDLGNNFNPETLGFPSTVVSAFYRLQFPYFNLGDTYSQLGTQNVSTYSANDNYSLSPNMTWVSGKHILKFGGDFRRYNDNTISPGSASGEYDFGKNWTQANPANGDDTLGNEIASFLLGYPSDGLLPYNINPAYHNWYTAFYFQDDFKVARNFTLNMGLRWDYETPRVERYNRQVVGFGFDTASPIASAVASADGVSNCPACSALKGGLEYAGVGGNSNYPFKKDLNNFGPRIGFAWSFKPNWVLRGGYGLMYLGQSASGANTGYTQTTPITSSLDGGNTPAASLTNPFIEGYLQPIGNTQGLSTSLGQSITVPYRNRPLPYSSQYSFGIQHEFKGGWLTDVTYVGNITKKLPENLNLNFLTASELQSIPEDQRATYFTNQVTNPMSGLIANSSLADSSISQKQLLYAFPQYSQVTASSVPIGWQRYDSLQAKVSRRYAKGLTFQASYTWSKTLEKVSVLNPFDVNLTNLTETHLEKRLNIYDTPHSLSGVVTYELPFGRGKQFGANMNSVVNGIAGGWNTSLQQTFHEGFPLTAATNACPTGSVKKNDSNFDVSVDTWINTSVYSGVALSPYDIRTCSTIYPDARLKNFFSTELAVFKQFSIRERVKIQIRADAQNLLNTPYFGKQQSKDVTSSTFGMLQADESGESRKILGIFKILF